MTTNATSNARQGGSRLLTKADVKKAEPKEQPYVLYDSRLPGLFLRVQPWGAETTGGKRRGGKKSWVIRYRHPETGKHTTMTIADARVITHPDKARELAKNELAEVLTTKETPVHKRRKARQAHDAKRTEQRRAAGRTLRKFLTDEYGPKYLAQQRSGDATEKRLLAAWADIADMDMATLTLKDADRVKARRLKKVKPQTIQRDWNALSKLLNQAVEWGVLEVNPLSRFKRPKVEDDKRVRYLGQHDDREDIRDENGKKVGERARFMAALEDKKTPEYLRVMTLLALHTGLRRGEIFGLEWKAVDLARRQITVTATTTKTARKRHIPMNETITGVLKKWRKGKGKVTNLRGLVFVNPETGEQFTTVKKAWASMVKRARVTDFTMHDCRHDFASRLIQADVNLYRVKELLGHSSIELTQRYAHLAPDFLAEAVEKL
ncbi:MAG TPA: DUF4102 domain-containing protein [Gammaproteobacteria bacterium]|nr:DUF4102 domain-containing protein [Gammaproteobacteria bacterium]